MPNITKYWYKITDLFSFIHETLSERFLTRKQTSDRRVFTTKTPPAMSIISSYWIPFPCSFERKVKSAQQVFRLSHVVLAIFGISTFWYLQKLLEILHLNVQKSFEKAKLKTKSKVKKVLYCDSHKTTGFIRIKLWKLFKECHFFPQENGCFAQNNYFLWKEYVVGHKSFLKW